MESPKLKTVDEQVRRAKFYMPDGTIRFLQVSVRPSGIKGAGMGAFCVDPIPKGAYTLYRGTMKNAEDADFAYSWVVLKYNVATGKTGDKVLGYLDGSKKDRTTNFTRYVNCGQRSKDNNMACKQVFAQMRYIAVRDIQPLQEIFCDYGEGYRKERLGITGKY